MALDVVFSNNAAVHEKGVVVSKSQKSPIGNAPFSFNTNEDYEILLKKCLEQSEGVHEQIIAGHTENPRNSDKKTDNAVSVSTNLLGNNDNGALQLKKIVKSRKSMEYSTMDNVKYHKKKKSQGKLKKWKTLPSGELGFQCSLFPRRITVNSEENTKEVEKEFKKFHTMPDFENCQFSNVSCGNVKLKFNWCKHNEEDQITEMYDDLEICKSFSGKLRNKKKWKISKASKQVKSKHCINVSNGGHKKKLYIKHRIIKLMKMEIDIYRSPSSLSVKKIDKSKGFKFGSKPKFFTEIPRIRISKLPGKGQNRHSTTQQLGHAIDAYNFDGDFSAELVNVLQTIQYRDINPEDYDLLLRLDERIKPKTLDNVVLDAFKTDIVDNKSIGELCMVCLEPYELNQKRKFLPCGHVFHDQCIILWLNNSTKCPIDNSEIEPS